MGKLIRTSCHTTKFANLKKQEDYQVFRENYRQVVESIVNHLWENRIMTHDKSQVVFDIADNRLTIPSFVDNELLKQFKTDKVSQRCLQAAGKQACAMIRAATEHRRKQLFMLAKLQKEGKDIKYLQRKIDTVPLVKPGCENVNPELDSRFFDIDDEQQPDGRHFDVFVQLKSFSSIRGESIRIPTRHTKVSRHWQSLGRPMGSIGLGCNKIYFRYEVSPKEKAHDHLRTVGADQGMTTCLTLSDGQSTGCCPHGHDLMSILQKMTRQTARRDKQKKNAKKSNLPKRPGSRGFARASEHRKNYINWSINQLDFSAVGDVRLEQLVQMRTGNRNTPNKNRWVYTQICKKLKELCEVEGTEFSEVPNEFRSQRCSHCGFVHKSNRKGKTFKCLRCGFVADADLNAASNLEIDLFEIPFWVRSSRLNRQGFFWKPDGLFDGAGTGAPIVPRTTTIQTNNVLECSTPFFHN